MKRIFTKIYVTVIFCFLHIIIWGQNSLPTSGPVVINNTLTVTGGAAFGSTVGMTNNYFLYWNDTGGTARRIIGVTPTNNVHIGDVDNVLNGSNIFQTKNNHSFYNNGNYTFGINSIGQTYFTNNVWHASIDGIKRFYYELNGITYFGTNSSYVFRNSSDKDMAFLTPQGNMSIAANQANGDAYLEIGTFKTGVGNSYLDLVGDATYPDFGLRLIRANGGANTDSYLQNRGTGTLNIEAVDAGGINLKTNGSNRLYINSSGNIGVGSVNPAQKLSVTTSTDFDGITLTNSTQSPTIRLNSGHANASARNWGITTNHFNFGDFNILGSSTAGGGVTSAWLTISKEGNVGLTNTNPIAKLDVSGTTRLGAGIADSWFPYIDNYVYISGKGIIFRKDNTSNSLELMRIAENGNIGVGTTNPTNKLQIIGNQPSRLLYAQSTNNLYPTAEFSANSANYSGDIVQISSSNTITGRYFNIYNSSSEGIFQVFGNNNVLINKGSLGVGTSAIPTDYKLAVAGNVIAEKVKVKKSNTWPDFVLSPSYKLPSLTEVESFIKQNSHLPEIPSAAEIEKDGQDLGEMNRLLLKKVEELTLYLIEEKKRNDNLQKRVEILENTQIKK